MIELPEQKGYCIVNCMKFSVDEFLFLKWQMSDIHIYIWLLDTKKIQTTYSHHVIAMYNYYIMCFHISLCLH